MNDACGHMKVVGISPCESKLRLGKRCFGAWGSPITGGFSDMGRRGKNGCYSLIFVLLFPRKMSLAGLGIARHPSCTFKSHPFGMGFHLLQGFGERDRERECLTYVAACTGYPRLVMAQLVSGAAPSWFGVSQNPRGASYKAAPLMNQAPERKMHPGTPVTSTAIGVCRAVCVWGSQAAPLPSLLAQPEENVLR